MWLPGPDSNQRPIG